MKEYLKEIIILILQAFVFYLLPMCMGNIGAIGMILLILFSTLSLSLIMGSISKNRIKFLYPVIVSLMFIPSMFIYYNESALIHSVWYLVVSIIGLLVGIIIYKLTHKNNLTKNILIIIGVIIGIILLDSIQALVFDNNPIFKIRAYYNGGTLNYKDRGFLVDTYCGVNGRKDTVIKGFSYSLSYDDNFKIIDTSKESEDISFATSLEEIYEDEKYIYYLPCIKSQYIDIEFANGKKYNIIPALQNGYINIGDLDKFDIHYIKQEKYNDSNTTTPYIPNGMDISDEKEDKIPVNEKEYNREPKNVTIEVLKETITNKSLEILITDNNQEHYGWGVDFKIQKKVNEKWQDLKYISKNLSWIDIAYELNKDNQLTQKLDIEKYYGQLNKGTYRVVKFVYDKGYIDLYSNEFEIE